MWSALKKWRRGSQGEQAAFPDGPVTTELDVRMCFRLLLDRPPNPEEWPGHSAQAGHALGPVVAGYVNSLEFARRGLMQPDPARAPKRAEFVGFSIYADPSDLQIGQHVLAGSYEPEVAAVFHDLLRPGMKVIDIGANIGYFTMLAASLVGPSGAVLAIEPNPANTRLLEASRRANGFQHVTAAQVAAGRDLGLLMLNTTHSNGTTSDFGDDTALLLAAQTVACVPVDILVAGWGAGRRVDLVKIDVEGAEYNALMGAQALLARDRPVIISEFAPDMMPAISGVTGPDYLRLLTGHGYTLSVIHPNAPIQPAGQDIAAVMAAYTSRGTDHIDIIATPPSHTGTH